MLDWCVASAFQRVGPNANHSFACTFWAKYRTSYLALVEVHPIFSVYKVLAATNLLLGIYSNLITVRFNFLVAILIRNMTSDILAFKQKTPATCTEVRIEVTYLLLVFLIDYFSLKLLLENFLLI